MLDWILSPEFLTFILTLISLLGIGWRTAIRYSARITKELNDLFQVVSVGVEDGTLTAEEWNKIKKEFADVKNLFSRKTVATLRDMSDKLRTARK